MTVPVIRAGTDRSHPLVARAAEVAPTIAKTARQTVEARRALPQNVALMKEAGLVGVLQPKRCGGHEASHHVHLDVVAEIAQACGSTGWCLGVWHAHSWLIGCFGADAQSDVYAKDRNAIISAVLGPRGKARKVDGGYRLNGFWPFCSGVHHSQWVMLGALVEDDQGNVVDAGILLLPTADVAIQDDWYVAGLTGTGSNSVAAKDVVVPAHRFLPLGALLGGQSPGLPLHDSTLYQSAAVPVLALFIASPAIGMARHALAHFIERLPGRTISYTFDAVQMDNAATHFQVATAATKLDTANLVFHHMIDEVEHYAGRREEMPFVRRAKARMDCAWGVKLALESVEAVVYAAGGSALNEWNGVQMAARDVRAVNHHGLLMWETNLEMYGRALLGLAPSSPLI